MPDHKKRTNILSIMISAAFFVLFLVAGLKIYDDFGPVSEERNQIDAGHIIWAYLTGDNSHYPELPPLEEYMNRYYGQGATFITVLLEALSGFTWDVNRIWKVRRLWNFLCFFAASLCLFGIVKRRYKSFLPAFFAVLGVIMLPRMFPEVFYNDRDPLFLSWMVFSFCAMLLFIRKTNLFTAILMGSAIAVTVNIRMFGMMFILPILLILRCYPSKRRWLIFTAIAFILLWYGLTPIVWKDPLKMITTSIIHLTTKQRMLDTQGSTTLLFAGKYYLEQELPWFYLPLWMLISTPVMLICLALFGGFSRFLKPDSSGPDERGYYIIDISLAMFFLLFIIGIPIIRPTLYSGWRHFYFLNLSLVWFAVYGLERVRRSGKVWLRYGVFFCESLSLVLTLIWMITAHPYEGIYYNPVFRQAAADNFERDMGFTSTKECLEYLVQNSPDQKIEVMNANAFIPFSLIGLPKSARERFSTIDWKIQRVPMKYIIFNYNNRQGNDQTFPYYAPIYNIERNGTKLAEIFQRTNNTLLSPEEAIESVHANVNDENIAAVLTENSAEIWQGNDIHTPEEEVTIRLKDGLFLESAEIFPGDSTAPSEALHFYSSEDGTGNWLELKAERLGTNGWKFSRQDLKWLKICSDDASGQPWQIRQILFYGKKD